MNPGPSTTAAASAPDYCPLNGLSLAMRLAALSDLAAAPTTASRKGPLTAQQRGYCFEALLRDLLAREGLQPRSSYSIHGEQIDGSFVLDGRVFLLEAKWTANPLPASAVYAFRGKVDGKLTGTIGFLISMSGFSREAAEAVAHGKDLNVLLVDGDDLAAAVGDNGSFAAMARVKLRVAAEEGVVFRPSVVGVDGAVPSVASPLDLLGTLRGGPTAIAFVAEAPIDARIVGELGRRVLRDAGSQLEITTHVALGATNGVRLASSLRDLFGPEALIGVVVDADHEPAEAVERRLADEPGVRANQIIVTAVAPAVVAAWLELPGLGPRGQTTTLSFAELLEAVDIGKLREKEPSFARFAELLEKHAAFVAGRGESGQEWTDPTP